MARQQHPRENIIAEATALVERVELRLAGVAEPVVAGFRRDRSLALFFGEDPVYQFNSRSQLRRAFVAGQLYKAQANHLFVLTRNEQAGRIQLVTEELPAAATSAFITAIHARLADLAAQLSTSRLDVVAQVPLEADVVARLRQWLAALPERIEIADSPHAR
jgi:hypothetical protein